MDKRNQVNTVNRGKVETNGQLSKDEIHMVRKPMKNVKLHQQGGNWIVFHCRYILNYPMIS